MGVKFIVEYHEDVVSNDIPKLTHTWKKNIRLVIDKKLTIEPEIFGKPLRRSLKGYRSLQVGGYRVVFRIDRKTVKVILIEHRSVVCKEIDNEDTMEQKN